MQSRAGERPRYRGLCRNVGPSSGQSSLTRLLNHLDQDLSGFRRIPDFS